MNVTPLKITFLIILFATISTGCSKKQPDQMNQKTVTHNTIKTEPLKLHCIKKGIKKICFHIPENWKEQRKDFSWVSPKEITLNYIVEKSDLTLQKYLESSKIELKKTFSDYVVISEKIDGNRAILEASATISGNKLSFFSGVIVQGGDRYVLSIGGRPKTFYAERALLQRMINSFQVKQ